MKTDVNGRTYDVEVAENSASINGNEVSLKVEEDDDGVLSLTIDGEQFFVDFYQEGEPSFMIINGSAFLVSRNIEILSVQQLRAPISGEISDVSVAAGSEVVKGQLLLTLEAMKMENQLKSPAKGKVKEVRVRKGQSVRSGEVLVTFE